MFKMLNPKRFYHAVGKRKFLEFILFAVFILFFYGPILIMLMLAFANEYTAPNILPQEWGFKWWEYVFSQDSPGFFHCAVVYRGDHHNRGFHDFSAFRRLILSRDSNTAAASCSCCRSC